MLHIELECQFDDFILRVNQQLPSNRIIGLFGASGSGKSRLIRQILGFDKHTQSKAVISFDQQVWQNKDSEKYNFVPCQLRGIGYLPQTVDLFPHLTVKQNILFGCDKRKTKLNSSSLTSISKQLDIEDLLSRFPKQLSGGQKQRVGLARAILATNHLLILDEPLSAIGEDHKPKVMQLLKMLNDRYQIPIIFSSHNRVEHAFLTDYLLTFEQGEIDQAGDYDHIATDINGNYAQMSDAINHIEAEVVQFEKEYSVNRLKTKSHQLWAGYQSIAEKSNVRLEIRAQDISLFISQTDQSSMLNCLEVTIVDFEEISRHQYLIKLAFEDSYLLTFITKKSFSELNLKKEMNLYARFKAVSVLPISIENTLLEESV